METAAPVIYARVEGSSRETWWGRMLALGIAGACLAVLITAARLTPSPHGLGTHQGLGLEECQFLRRTGLPCPGCGMTTSFSWFVRGNLVASFYIQPMGFVLAALCSVCTWAGAYIAVTGRPIYRLLSLVPGRYWVMPLLGLAVAGWGWKIFIHLSGHDGW